jgi:glycosyltransferase involved in cell wall biosynthesis
MEKILITGNGGIFKDKRGNYWGQKSTGEFIKSFQIQGYQVLYVSHKVKRKSSEFLYNYNYTENNIACKSIKTGRRHPRRYIGKIVLLWEIFRHEFVYIFYPGGISANAANYSNLLGKNYGLYIRGIAKFEKDESIIKKAKFLTGLTNNIKQELSIYNSNFHIIRSMMNIDVENVNIIGKNAKLNVLPVLLFVGSLKKHKGVPELIEMSMLLTEMGFKHLLNVIGDGDLLPLYTKLQERGEIPKNIKFFGGINDKEILFNQYLQANAFVFPTHNEGLPRVLLEAMLAKTPIFTTIVGGIKDFMKNKYNCIEIPVSEPKEQAKIIYVNINNENLMEKLSDEAYKTVINILKHRKSHHEVLRLKLKELEK